MVSELEAAAIFPRRAATPEETVDGIMFLLENSMMNACDVCANVARLTPASRGRRLADHLKLYVLLSISADLQGADPRTVSLIQHLY